MGAGTRRTVVAFLGGAVSVIVAGWYDAVVLPTLQVSPDSNLGGGLGENALAVGTGYVALAAGILILALLTRGAHSRSVDVFDAVGGASIVLVGMLLWPSGLAVTDAPAAIAIGVLGWALLLIGLGDLRGALWVRPRPSRAAGAPRGMAHVQS
jgi:hypothetical protein